MSKLLLSMVVTGVAALAQAPQSAQTPPAANPPAAARPDGLYAHFKTSMGDITIQLYEKDTPIAVRNFVGLAKGTKPWKDPKTGAMVKRPCTTTRSFIASCPTG